MSADTVDYSAGKILSLLAVRNAETSITAFLGPYTVGKEDQDLALEDLRTYCNDPNIDAAGVALPDYYDPRFPLVFVYAKDATTKFLVVWLHDFDQNQLVDRIDELRHQPLDSTIRMYCVRTREASKHPIFKKPVLIAQLNGENHVDPMGAYSGVQPSAKFFLDRGQTFEYGRNQLNVWRTAWILFNGEAKIEEWAEVSGGHFGVINLNGRDCNNLVTVSKVDVSWGVRKDLRVFKELGGPDQDPSSSKAVTGGNEERVARDEGDEHGMDTA